MTLPSIDPASVRIEPSWRSALSSEFSKPYFAQIKKFLAEEKSQGITVFPPGPLIFNAFDATPFDKVRVVILGQDPYHGPGQAMGLCFSVPKNIALPPSLRNVYKEIERDTGIQMPLHGDLTGWTTQGIFLLNTALTVRANQANSHSKIGWHLFTDSVIRILSSERDGIIFLLWGNHARSKRDLIDVHRHTILEAAHPSPLARDAFSGCGHFSKTNDLLALQGQATIHWNPDYRYET